MGLSLNQLREQLTTATKTATLSKAISHQNRIKFHAQCAISKQLGQPITEFFGWVDSLLPIEKANLFKCLFRFPIKTNEVTGVIFDRFSKIFDGRNPAFSYQFANSEQRDDWEWYRQEILDSLNKWQTVGWEHFKTEINSVLIVDMPTERESGLPEPYFYWLTLDRVISYEVADETKGIMSWIIFKMPDDKIAVFDDETYRVFDDPKGKELSAPIVENPHELGYCPARFFWDVPLTLKEPDIKAHPLSRVLADLDYLLFFHTSKKHLDLHAAYPIYSGYEQDCDYHNSENGEYCDRGLIRSKEGHYLLDATSKAVQKCPACGSKRIIGAGSFVEIPIPTKDSADLREPVQMLNVDGTALEYNVEEEERLRENLINSVCGTSTELVNEMAVNDKQVSASFESQNTVLNRIKKGFENAMNWTDETICRLRYGSLFLSANINLGTEFYTLTSDTLWKQYQNAKSSGASESELDALQTQIMETQYRNNPIQLQRMVILAELEPYRHYSRVEALDLYNKNLISLIDLQIKLNFSTFVKRFERENMNIIEFGSMIPFEKKIEIINQKFIDYVKEQREIIS